jgi:hypothetical protein
MKAFLAALVACIALLPGTAATFLPSPKAPLPMAEESRDFGAVTFKEVHPVVDAEHRWTWNPWYDEVKLSVTAGDISITDNGKLGIHSSHWQCQGFISLSDYEEVSSDVRLEHALGSLLGACHLPVAEVTQWRAQIRAQAPDIMAAVAYMKERWVALTNSSLARCDKTVPTMPAGLAGPPPINPNGQNSCGQPVAIWIQNREEQAEQARRKPTGQPTGKPAPNRR